MTKVEKIIYEILYFVDVKKKEYSKKINQFLIDYNVKNRPQPKLLSFQKNFSTLAEERYFIEKNIDSSLKTGMSYDQSIDRLVEIDDIINMNILKRGITNNVTSKDR